MCECEPAPTDAAARRVRRGIGCGFYREHASACACACASWASIKASLPMVSGVFATSINAHSEKARRCSGSRAGGAQQLGDGCQPGPWHHLCSETTRACSHTPASYPPLELFTPGSVCFSPTTASPAPAWVASCLHRNACTPVN